MIKNFKLKEQNLIVHRKPITPKIKNKKIITKKVEKMMNLFHQNGVDIILGRELLGLSTSSLFLGFRGFFLGFLFAFPGLLRFLPHGPSAKLELEASEPQSRLETRRETP